MPATAASLPPELFAHIVKYAGTEQSGDYDVRVEGNARQELLSCSLVCLDWANWCRPLLFQDPHGIRLKALAELKILDFYTFHGCSSLTPLLHMTRRIHVWQSWEEGLSYQSVYCLSRKFTQAIQAWLHLILHGPMPVDLPLRAYRSPPWLYCLPRSMPPSLLPFKHVCLQDVHFPCLSIFRLCRGLLFV